MRRALASLCLVFVCLPALAQMPAAAKPDYYLIHEEVARPGMLAQYESATRELINTLTEQKADPNVMAMSLFTSTDLHYLYVVHLNNFGSIDTINQIFGTVAQAVGNDKWSDLMRRGNSTMASYNEFVVNRRTDLSYAPAAPRLKPEEQKFFHWQFYYIDAAHTGEAEQVSKEFAALFKSKNIDNAFTVYQAVNGNDLPLYVVATSGKSASDYYAHQDAINAIIGNDAQKLQARVFNYTRKFEVKDATARPELSYPMPAAAPAK